MSLDPLKDPVFLTTEPSLWLQSPEVSLMSIIMLLGLHLLRKVIMTLLSPCVCGTCSVLSQPLTDSAILSPICPLCHLTAEDRIPRDSFPSPSSGKSSSPGSPGAVLPLPFALCAPPPGLHAGILPELLQGQPKGFQSPEQGCT